jgi:hypothetical protein
VSNILVTGGCGSTGQGRQRSEGSRSEDGGRMSEVRGQRSEDGRQRTPQ